MLNEENRETGRSAHGRLVRRPMKPRPVTPGYLGDIQRVSFVYADNFDKSKELSRLKLKIRSYFFFGVHYNMVKSSQ